MICMFKYNNNINNMKDSFIKIIKKGFKTTKTHYYSGGYFTANSGIKVCIFGSNSGMANGIIKNFLSRGTPVNLVHRNIYDAEIPLGEKKLFKASNPYKKAGNYFSDYSVPDMAFHQVRTYGDVGYRMFTYCPDLMNEYEMENAIKDCDVVINCIGNNTVLRHMEDYEEANVLIPRQLAKICSRLKNNPVKRLIHFSANNVDPDSESKRLRTKWLGEKEILNYFPEATIIRPTEIIHNKLDSCFIG